MRGVIASLGLVVLASQAARADTLPWVDPGDVPLPSGVSSVEILRHDEPLLVRPRGQAARRGSAAEGAHLPLYGATRGPGCPGRWLSVGPLAWVCETGVRLSLAPALKATVDRVSFGDGLPYRYHFVGQNGSLGYVSLRTAEEIAPDAELQPGFAVAIVEVARKGRDSYGRTTHGLWLPMRDLNPARRFPFHGQELRGELSTGWVYEKSARVYEKPGGRRTDEVHAQFEALQILETKERAKHRWFRIGDERWVSDREVRVPTPATRPEGVGPLERWLDVEIDNQVLVAYEGNQPVFATLVSTGRGKGKSVQATPKGIHRIWVKLRSSDMTNLQDEEASRYYAIEDVPWVMFFEKGYGLHGTFWHRSFGKVKSHGCVNLAPLDAERLFYWTSPRVPTGWTAALPTEYEPGTVVRVR